MKLYKGIHHVPEQSKRSAVTIGNFDGVHLGHQKIVQIAVDQAKTIGGQAIVYTFRPHPQLALHPEKKVHLLSTYEERLQLLTNLGIDVIVEEPFDLAFSQTSAEEFFSKILIERLKAETIVVGYDFAFGRKRSGHLDNLSSFCSQAGVQLHVVPPQNVGEEVVSSSLVRQYINSGDIEKAGILLGHPFSYEGIVVHGEGRGKKLGFPTANLQLDPKMTLPNGVYATRCFLLNSDGTRKGKPFLSVTNIGVRPTFEHAPEAPAIQVECHLLDTNQDLYDSRLHIDFSCRLRDERKFNGIEELKAQIQKDIAEARSRR